MHLRTFPKIHASAVSFPELPLKTYLKLDKIFFIANLHSASIKNSKMMMTN